MRAITYYCDLCNSAMSNSHRGVLHSVNPGSLRYFDWLTARVGGRVKHICLHCREDGKTRKDLEASHERKRKCCDLL